MIPRRAFMLIHVLGAMALLSVAGTVLAVSLGSILSAQRGVAALSNRFAILDDYTSSLRRDLLRADRVALQVPEEGDGAAVLRLAAESAEWEYRFESGSLKRRVLRGPWDGDKSWSLPHTQVSPRVERSKTSQGGLMHLIITWQRRDKKDPHPAKRFDLALPFGHVLAESE
jgi:hypothetical protein